MDFGAGTYALGFTAGLLSILSPCVLPLIPLLVAGAASAHRFGVFALSAGLMISFTVAGLFVATIGFAIGTAVKVAFAFVMIAIFAAAFLF